MIENDFLVITYNASGGHGQMRLYLPEVYKRPSITWTNKLFKVLKNTDADLDEIKTSLWEWLEAKFHDGSHPDPEDEEWKKDMAKSYADARQIAADLIPKIQNSEIVVKRMADACKGLPKKAPQREMLKKAREELKGLKDKQKAHERKAKDILRFYEENKRDYENWLKLIALVAGGN